MEKQTSCINVKPIFDYVKARNNGNCSVLIGNLDPEIDALNDPVAFLTDPNNWISNAVIVKLFERAKHILNEDYKRQNYAKLV